MKHLFAYGTLMCGDIMQDVSGCCPPAEDVTLPGYRRCRVRDECYPAIVTARGSRVEGRLYRGLPAAAWPRLDRFEGQMYDRVTVQVHLPDGSTILAETYVLGAAHRDCMTDEAWDLAFFCREGKASFLRGYRDYGER